MPTPSKPIELVLLDGKSHRTKAEIKQRQDAEEALITGKHMQMWPEVKDTPLAKKEFNRVRGLFKTIGKDDALYEGVVNRYAMLRAECAEFEDKRERFYRNLDELENSDMDAKDKFKLEADMQKNIISLDRQIQTKRRMLLDIEKENIMTIASSLRSIPKKPQKDEKPSGMAAFMSRREAK